ncbi:HAMP domain-containing sensor histidine kinase [Winogradskya consettensis]|uniref:histidine kinase n=1 Tax=Winogradskya consettensis TaxID=113560 RepID=A0A919SJ02_9ACTN|nr:HAMP domain-containing sensor histidine kinase [Actinoplanes consettensis]GIM71843.1 two-component sensor histidine kinase [Actinoplanes consettensis]
MPRPQLPVRVRAAAAAALAAALCLGGGALWLRHVIYANSVAGSLATAQSQARAIAATYDTPAARINADGGALANSPGDCDVEKDPERCAYDRWYEFPYFGLGISFAVVDERGKLLLAQNQLAYYVRESGLTFPAIPPEPDDDYGRVDVLLRPARSGAQGQFDGRAVTLVTYNVSPSGATVYMLLSPLDAEAAVAPVDRWLRRGLPLAVLFVAAVAWWAAGRALRPVERMRDELARITAADMSSRVPQPRTGDEIARLAVTMNETLDRLTDAAERQRRFVADAAHELRSPLAGLRNIADVAVTHGGAVDPEVLRTGTERLQRLTDDLLLLARLERTAPARGRPVDIAATAEELVGERRYRVPPDERFVVVAGGPALVIGREGELARMLGNLLENASRYARDRITVTVAEPEPGVVRVEVQDDGPGIPQADRERVFERFARVDEARDRSHGGAGLGLAIARDIAVRHGGRLYAADTTDGARLVAELPQAPRT